MPFRFKKKESVARAVRRLCCERLDDALETMERGEKLDAVHAVRKEIKKLRSILRLVRGKIGKSAYGDNAVALRDAAHSLNDFRDAQVKLSALDSLAKHCRRTLPPKPFSAARRALAAHCRGEEHKLAGSIVPVKQVLGESRKRLKKLKMGARGWKAIEPGLKKIYSRGRCAFEAARDQPTPESFHEWRKRVKDLSFELRLLAPASPRHIGARTDKLEKLGDLLGDDHDLVMLREFIAQNLGHAPGTAKLDRCIALREEELRLAALKAGGRFYREKPRHFCRRLGAYWKDWRGKK